MQKPNRNIQVKFAHLPGQIFSTGTKDLREAILFAEGVLERDWRILNNNPECITLRNYAKDFFSESDPKGIRERNALRNRNYDESYYKHHQGRLDNYILPAFGKSSLDSITKEMVDDWFIKLKSVQSGKKLSSNSKNKVLKCFQIVMDQAVRDQLIEENPIKNIEMIVENDINTREAFTAEELKKLFPEDPIRLLQIWNGLMWTTYFLIMRDTGWRPGEVLGLRKDSYFPELNGIYTDSSVTRGEFKHSIKTTNRGQKYKVGILTDLTKKFLENLIEKTEGEFLFKLPTGFISANGANKHLAVSAEKAGVALNGRTQYSLRHSFETALAGKVENKTLLELMAHTSFRPEYDHRTPEDILELLQPVKKILEDRGEKKK